MFFMGGPSQHFFQCGTETLKGWTPLLKSGSLLQLHLQSTWHTPSFFVLRSPCLFKSFCWTGPKTTHASFSPGKACRIYSHIRCHGKLWKSRPMHKQQHLSRSTIKTVSELLLAFYISRAGVRLQAYHSLAVRFNTSSVPKGPNGVSN